MTSERAKAYGRVMSTLREAGEGELSAEEKDRVREAADTLLFCESQEECADIVAEIETFATQLVEGGRWSQERADNLMEDLVACGPVTAVSEG